VPFLRVIRDKRGYETTYLMHWFRENNRQQSRVLYVFRTPGGVRVGREPLEQETLREIEARHPGIEFDWAAVLDNRQIVDSATPEQRRPPRKRRRDEEAVAAQPPPAAAPKPAPPAPAPAAPRFVVPSKIEGDTREAQVAFLAHWYEVVYEQIEQRANEPARREALLVLAAQLNPGEWTDEDQVTAGLQQASEALERLSHVFAKRRRRSRRKKGSGPVREEENGAVPADDDRVVLDGDGSVRAEDSATQFPPSTHLDPSSTDPVPPSTNLDPSSTTQSPPSTNLDPSSTDPDPASTNLDPSSTNLDPFSTS
jgi:hypothetical protein